MATCMFPSSVWLGPGAVGWRLDDIAAWSAAGPRSSR
ncbi:AlpA family phage regulatory protein [Pelomonas saccharophila]|nr:AlpA family phage regulatory protein [Roseateles saccharophilus]